MKTVRFIMVGGFLGAGKTTTLSLLARHYQQQGLKVGIITNDQANNLVDTVQFRTQGLPAEEIPGGCFCCRFEALTEAAGKLTQAERPDVLLAEPVGSCTDLVATVVQPLKRLYADRYQVAPYIVLLDPVRARKVLTGEKRGGFSPKVVYIFNKQLEEADGIVINKVDTLSTDERDTLVRLIRERYPRTQVLLLSARNGEGVDEVIKFIEQPGAFGRNIPEVDYDFYADGEAELGWLNGVARLNASVPFAADAFLSECAASIQRALQDDEAEVAHLKMLIQAGGRTGIINLVRGDGVPELSRQADTETRQADLIVNARIHTDPELLWHTVQRCLNEVCQKRNVQMTPGLTQRFKPGRPVPTHRYAEAV